MKSLRCSPVNMLEFGLTAQEFRTRYLEQQPCVHQAALAERPVQWSDIDALLHAIEADDSVLQLFNNGQLPSHAYSETSYEMGRQRRRLNKDRFYELLQSGATLVLNRIESHLVTAQRLCIEIANFTGYQTTSNAYMSFGGGGTFGTHWDTHDVFAIQLIGKKRWQVFAPTFPLPLSHQTSKQSQHQCPVRPVLDCILQTGDMLYIPRGWWHNVIPLDESSLHLSVGVYLPTLSDYIMWVCSRQLPQQIKARGGLIDDAASLSHLSEVMQTITQAVMERQHLSDFRNELQSRERLLSEFNTALFLDQPFLDKSGADPLDSSRLMLTLHGNAHLGTTDIRINGARMQLQPLSREIVTQLDAATSLTFVELCARLPGVATSNLRSAVLELARHEVINIEQPQGNNR